MTFSAGRKMHPELDAYLRKLRAAKFISLASLVVVPAVFVLIWVSGNFPGSLLGPLRLAVVVIALVSYLVIGRIVDKAQAVVEAAARVLATVEPQAMILEIVGTTRFGALRVRLRSLDETSDSSAPGMATVRSTRNKLRLPRGPHEVRVHFQPLSVDRSLVIEGPQAVYWGYWSESAGRRSAGRSGQGDGNEDENETAVEAETGPVLPTSLPRWLKRIGALMILLLIAVGVLFAVVSMDAIQQAQRDLALARASLNWQRVPGRIVAARLQRKTIHKSRGTSVIYQPAIVFQYDWHGNLRRGRLIHFGFQASKRKNEAQRWLKKYPVGRQVMIAVAPGPSPVAVLEAGHADDCEAIIARRKGQLMVMMMVILFTLVVTLLLFRFLVRRGTRLLTPLRRSKPGRNP